MMQRGSKARWRRWGGAAAALLALVMVAAGVVYHRLFAVQPAVWNDAVVPDLAKAVNIRRDNLGIPRIEAASEADLARAMGWVMAEDRLAQMVTLSLVAQGRLSEFAGEPGVGLDRLMRTLDLAGLAKQYEAKLSPESLQYLEHFSAGVNQYLSQHQGKLSPSLQVSDWEPEAWRPIDSLSIMLLFAHALSLNVGEELAFLSAAARVGPRKAAWLFPVYSDQGLPFDETERLMGLSLKEPLPESVSEDLESLSGLMRPLGQLAASNSWALRPELTRHGASLLANDTHLLLTQPCVWMVLSLITPDHQMAGVALPGVPLIIAGASPTLGWGVTMAMADTQDIFLERLAVEEGQWTYETPGGWEPVETRSVQIKVRGRGEQTLEVQSTRHGPLLNTALQSASHDFIQPFPLRSEYGLSLASALSEPDQTFDAFMALNRAHSMDEALIAAKGIRAIAVNLTLADPQHIGWTLTGRFPLRKQGKGQFPAPGWSGDYDWEGYSDPESNPIEVDPDNAFYASANHRILDPFEQPFQISSSWYAPERYERLVQTIQSVDEHDLKTSLAMQNDRLDLFFTKVKARWQRKEIEESLSIMRGIMDPDDQRAAAAAYDLLMSWDGRMDANSSAAALWGMFEHQLMRSLFLDELGPEDSSAWKSFVRVSAMRYPALQDHLLGRVGSPFWDNISTPEGETRYHIVNQALAAAYRELEVRFGDPGEWRWGELHRYQWISGMTQVSMQLDGWEGWFTGWLGKGFDRGPFEAGGDRNTLNVAGFSTGIDFDAWNIPAMRMIVDFSLEEPLHLVIAGGQSDDPRSPHYDDGIAVWLRPEIRRIPLSSAAVDEQFSQVYRLTPGAESGGEP